MGMGVVHLSLRLFAYNMEMEIFKIDGTGEKSCPRVHHEHQPRHTWGVVVVW